MDALGPRNRGDLRGPQGAFGHGFALWMDPEPKEDGSDGALAFAAIVLRKPSQPRRGRTRASLVPRVDPPEPP